MEGVICLSGGRGMDEWVVKDGRALVYCLAALNNKHPH